MKPHRLLDPVYQLLDRSRPRTGAPSGVLIVSAGGLGDTVLFSQVVDRFARLAHPDEPVTVLLRSDAMAMGFLFPPFMRLEGVDYGLMRQPAYRRAMFHTLWRAHYRLVIHTDYMRHPDLDEALVMATDAPSKMAMVARHSPKHGPRLQKLGRQYTKLFQTEAGPCDKVLRWVAFANSLTDRNDAPPVLHRDVVSVPLERPTAVLQPFSAVALKQSPLELWQRIIAALPADWDVLVAGHPKDLAANPAYESVLDGKRVRFEGAKFRDLAPILAAARMVISVDTACLHLAALVGAPTLCLASAAFVGEIVPYDPAIAPANLTVLHATCAHQGCLGACHYAPIQGMYPCVADLDPAQVEAWIGTHR